MIAALDKSGHQTEERTMLQAQLTEAQKMESIGRLAGGVSHDFNNMLAVILGYTELVMLKLGPDSPVTSQLEQVRKAAQQGAELTRQLLTFARKHTHSLAAIAPNAQVEETLTMLRRRIGEAVQVDWTPGDELWNIRADVAQINQMLANLAVNPRDAMAGLDERLGISTSNVVLDGAYVQRDAGARPTTTSASVFATTDAAWTRTPSPTSTSRSSLPIRRARERGSACRQSTASSSSTKAASTSRVRSGRGRR